MLKLFFGLSQRFTFQKRYFGKTFGKLHFFQRGGEASKRGFYWGLLKKRGQRFKVVKKPPEGKSGGGFTHSLVGGSIPQKEFFFFWARP